MKKLKEIAKAVAVPAVALLFPLIAWAQPTLSEPPGGVTAPSTINNINYFTSATGLFCVIINWIFWLLIVLVIIFVLVAAFKYLTAAGDPEKVKSAGATLLYAAIAVAVALIAKGLPLIVNSFLNGGLNGTGC